MDALHSASIAARAVVFAACGSVAAGCGSSVDPVTTGGASDSAGSGGAPSTTTAQTATSSTAVGSTGAGAGGRGMGGGGTGGGEPGPCASDSFGRPLAIRRGGGAGYTLAPAERIEVFQDDFSSVFVGDVTGDGRADIMGTEIDHAVLVAQEASGSLGAPTQIPHSWKNPGSATLLNLGGDELLDFAVIDEMGLEIFPSLGGGAFGPPTVLPTYYGHYLRAVDLDFDGHDDLVWVQYGDVAYAYGDGAGSFTNKALLPPSPLIIGGPPALVDMTGDMIPDLVHRGGAAFGDQGLVIVPHDGVNAPSPDGWFTIPIPGEAINGVDVGDLDGDGLVDIAWQEADDGEYDVRAWVMLATSGGFGPPIEIAQHGWGGGVRVRDVNADGRNDVVLNSGIPGAYTMAVVLSTPDGFVPQQDYQFPTAASVMSDAIAVGDVDCDGCPDVLGADVWGLDVFRGQGCGP